MKKLKKIKKTTKNYLALSGISVLVFIVSVLLHNFYYALAIISQNKPILSYVFEILQTLFFLIAVPIAPLVFSVGILGAASLTIQKLLKR
jgi:hypothetical protein